LGKKSFEGKIKRRIKSKDRYNGRWGRVDIKIVA
jgi:hypothetical protein